VVREQAQGRRRRRAQRQAWEQPWRQHRKPTYLQQLQRVGDALHPQLRQLGSACAAAAGAADGGAAEAEAEPEAAAPDAAAADAAAPPPRKQEKNVHALTVLRRIKCKLDGKDRWPGKERETKQSVSEQVETVIKQAVSVDNLCTLYEGWAAWL